MQKKYSDNLYFVILKSNNEKILVYEKANMKSLVDFNEPYFYYYDVLDDKRYIIDDFSYSCKANNIKKEEIQKFIIDYINKKVTHKKKYKVFKKRLFKK